MSSFLRGSRSFTTKLSNARDDEACILNWVSFNGAFFSYFFIKYYGVSCLFEMLSGMGKVTFFFFFKKLFGGMQSELILNLFVLYPMFSLLGSIALIASLIVNIPGIVGTKS